VPGTFFSQEPFFEFGSDWADPTHDAAGNMTAIPKPASPAGSFALQYDAWNRLVEVQSGMTAVQTNQYDGLGRRIVRDESGGSGVLRHYYYHENWQVVEERTGTSTTADRQYVWHPHYIDALGLTYSGSTAYWCTFDANFNVTAVVTTGGEIAERYGYTPYGEVKYLNEDFSAKSTQASGIGNTILFTGRERDPETGLQLNRHRFYAAHLGRWLSRDPIGYVGSRWLLYQYGNSSPLMRLDPHGLRDRTFCEEYCSKRCGGAPPEFCYDKCVKDCNKDPSLKIIRDTSRDLPVGDLAKNLMDGDAAISWGIYPGGRGASYKRGTIKLPKDYYNGPRVRDNCKCVEKSQIANELWHAWWDQVLEEAAECEWLYNEFQKCANTHYNGNMEMMDEAASETVSSCNLIMCMGRKATYSNCAQPPGHADPGEIWHGRPGAGTVISRPCFDLIMRAVENGCRK
jgi:RHS repeat-associated protein